MNDHMQRSLRHKTITNAVRGGDTVTVDALTRLTGASAVTIRRDLTELERHGAVTRTHGGVRAAKRGAPMPFTSRFEADQQRKHRLAEVVARLVADDESLIVDNGTTCFAVAQHLAGRPVTAMALSLHAAAALATQPGASVLVPGGPVETDTLAFVGTTAVDAVRNLHVDVAVLGACSASAAHGLTSTTFEDAQIKNACITAASRRILVTTAQKLSRTSTFRFGAIEDLTDLVTTDDAPTDTLAIFQSAGVRVQLIS